MDRFLSLSICYWLAACLAFLPIAELRAESLTPTLSDKQSTIARSNAVYLLGVDIQHAGVGIDRLRRSFSLSNDDRWALSDYVHSIAQQMPTTLSLASSIENWNPAEDPYNFGAVSVQGIDHNTVSWVDGQSRTYVSVNVAWIHVGHDLGTRFAKTKTPEIRFAVSEFSIAPFESRQPPTSAALDVYYKKAFDSAIKKLLHKVTQRYQRQVKRDMSEIRYVQVSVPIVLESAHNDLLTHYTHANVDQLLEKVPRWMASFLEDELMKRFQYDDRFNHIMLLPNLALANYIRSEWPVFSARVKSQSLYSANLDAIGFTYPQLLKLKPHCQKKKMLESDRWVTGYEVRSNLVSFQTASEFLSPGKDLVTQASFIAADVKLPLTKQTSLQAYNLDTPLPAIEGRYVWSSEKSKDIPLNDVLGPHLVPANLANVIDVLSDELAERLLSSTNSFPPLSHPSMKRLCQ